MLLFYCLRCCIGSVHCYLADENPYTQWVWIANPDQQKPNNRWVGMWLFYCLRCYLGSVHCFCGLKILILNGSGLQIQTNGMIPNIRWIGKRVPYA